MSWTGLNWTDQHPRFVADLTGVRRPKFIDSGNGGTWTTVGSSRSTFQSSQIVTGGLTDCASASSRSSLPGTASPTSSASATTVCGPPSATATARSSPRSSVSDLGGVSTGWRVDQHPRFLADLTGDGRADVVGFGDAGVWTPSATATARSSPHSLVNDFGGVSTGWRVDQHPGSSPISPVTAAPTSSASATPGCGRPSATATARSSPHSWSSTTSAVSSGWRVEQHPRFLADLTGDGRADIVGFGDAGVWTALNNGDGTFQPPQLVSELRWGQRGVAGRSHPRFLADLTGDGRADIVGFGDAGVWTSLGNGDGTFQPPQFVAATSAVTPGVAGRPASPVPRRSHR